MPITINTTLSGNKQKSRPAAHARRLISAFVFRFLKVSYLLLLQAKLQCSS